MKEVWSTIPCVGRDLLMNMFIFMSEKSIILLQSDMEDM